MMRYRRSERSSWIVAVADGRVLAVDTEGVDAGPGPDALIDALRSGSPLDTSLALLVARGVANAPGFVLVSPEAGTSLRCIVRGRGRVIVELPDGGVALDAAGVATWVEQSFTEAGAFRVELGEPGPVDDAGMLPIGDGVVWTDAVASGAVVAPVEPRLTVPYDREALAAAAAGPDPEGADARAEVRPAPEPDRPSEQTIMPAPDDDRDADSVEPDVAPPDAASADAAPAEAIPPVPELAAPEQAAGYDHLFGATIARPVEAAAVRPEGEADEEPAEPDAADDGDHDGLTVMSGDLRELRARSGRPATQATAVLPQLPAARFRLELPGGAAETLDHTLIVGRAPSVSQVPGGEVPRLLTINSADNDISRNHVRFAVEGGTVVVTDLHSRNGTTVVLPGRSPQKLRQGEPTTVIPGTVVDLGGGVTMTVSQLDGDATGPESAEA